MTKINDKTSAIRKHGLTKYYLWKAENQSGNEVLTEVKQMKLMTERMIIIGGGAKKLSDNKHSEVNVVDRNNYHFFPHFLYQVFTAFIEPPNNGK